MKQKRLKNYLKIGTLLFGIFLVVVACQKESFDNPQETTQEKKLKRITLNQLNSRIGNSNDYCKLSAMFDVNKPKGINYQQRLEASDNPYLLTDEIVMIEGNNTSYYTFRVSADSVNDEFYNLVVALDETETIISMRLLEYMPNNNWSNDMTQPFVGEVRLIKNTFFSDSDIANTLNQKSSISDCIVGLDYKWQCGANNNHGPGHPGCDPANNAVTELIIIPVYGPCPTSIDAGDSSSGGGFPVDGGNTGGGGGTPSDSSGNDADNENPPDDGEECIVDSNGNCLTDETTPLPPRDLIEDDDCDTSKEDLKKVFPNMSDTDASTLASVINDKGKDFGIDTKEKLQHFLAQAGHEVGGFSNGIGIQESLYYTTASRLKAVYKKYFKQNAADTLGTKRDADSTYLQNSSKVANYVYCCRMGNGNEASGDGYKYRGRGIFQLTGKTNYTNFKTWYNNKYDPDKDFVANPDQVKSNDTIAIISALWYYKTSVLDKITVDSTTTVKTVTKKVNGGSNGLSDRKEIHSKAKDSITCQ